MNYLLTIIVPIYNCEKYLPDLFLSIDNQKYKNYELLLINDGSTDNSEKICKEYILKNKKAKYFYKNNGGVSSTRNFGIEKAKGDFICFVDADDVITPDYLLNFSNLIKNNNKNSLFCCGIIKTSTPNIYNIKDSNNSNIVIYEKNKYDLLYSTFGGYTCNKMYDKKIIDKYSLKFDETIGMCEDKLFIFNYLKYCNSVICINNNNYLYRIINSSASKNLNNIKWFSIFKVFDETLNYKKLFNTDFYNKESFIYFYYLLQGKYRLSFIKNDSNYNIIKTDIKNRLYKLSIIRGNFSIKDKFRLFFYKYFNKISFYFKLKD